MEFLRFAYRMKSALRHICVPLLVFIIGVEAFGQNSSNGRLIENPVRNIPRLVRDVFHAEKLDARYKFVYGWYPYYFRGDFNGDGRKDYAVQVQSLESGKIGIAIIHGKRPQAISTPVTILGAGKSIANTGDDLTKIKIWSFVPQRNAPSSAEGDAIRLVKSDSTAGIIFWDGKHYSWNRSRRQ